MNTIDAYYVWSTVANDEAYYEFLNLFVSKESSVYNDFLGIKQSNDLSAEEYAQTMRYGLNNKKVFIRNVKIEGLSYTNGKTYAKLSLDKEFSYIDNCGTYYSSSYYDKDYHLIFTLVYEEKDRICKIRSITGEIASEKRLPPHYIVFEAKDDRDSCLTFRGNKLSFNKYHQAFIEGTTATISEKDFSYPDMSVGLKPYHDSCHMSIKYHIRRFRLKPHVDIGLGNTLSVENKSFYNGSSSTTNSFGIEIGYIFPSKRKITAGFYTGLGFSNSSLNLSYYRDLYSYTTTQDIDGDTYERIYEKLSLRQRTNNRELCVPIYMDFDWRISRWISSYVDLGLSLNLNLSMSANTFSGSAENVHGLYSKYDNLYLDHHWGYNGFTQELYLSKTDLCEGERISVKKFVPEVLLGAGFRFNIPRTTLAIDFGLRYQKAFNDIITIAKNYHSEMYNGKIIYNEINGTSSSEHVHDLMENAGGISRNYLKLSFGLILKF